jgi:ankyrin repeat protein
MRVWMGLLFSASIVWGADASPERILNAATRSIALLQSSQKDWYSKINCHSCHHQFQPALAFRVARAHGVPVDEAIARGDAVKAFQYNDLDAAVQFRNVEETTMDLSYALVAAEATGLQPNLALQVYARIIAARQDPAGNWDDLHQRPPQSYSRFTQTALGLRAIQLYSHPSQKADVDARVARARNWLSTHSPRDTEERTWQLIGLSWAGVQDRVAFTKAALALAATQHADGGWSSLDGRESDAYSTAEVLVALHENCGVATSEPAWRRGLNYLISTQAADGSWHVTSRLHPPAQLSPAYFESGLPYGHDQYLSASAGSLAVMALSDALPLLPKATQPAWRLDFGKGEPWVETVLFGSGADLQRLLDSGFDANSATHSGGTTALMMVAPDVEKMKLLLDHGANVKARAKSNYSAMEVAAAYRDGAPGMKLLLDRGAEVKGSPRSPMLLAAGVGDFEILKPLADAGDTFTGALLAAVRNGKPDAVRTLLELGAPVDDPDRAGTTPLERAVLANEVDIALMLIQHGADVNHVGPAGMTPLLYAASIDFGDSGMVRLLLKSGARRDAVSKDGLTALELARQYKHTHLLASLQAARPAGR